MTGFKIHAAAFKRTHTHERAHTQLLEHLVVKPYLQKSHWQAVLTLNVSINLTRRSAARCLAQSVVWFGSSPQGVKPSLCFSNAPPLIRLKFCFSCFSGSSASQLTICFLPVITTDLLAQIAAGITNLYETFLVIQLSSRLIYLQAAISCFRDHAQREGKSCWSTVGEPGQLDNMKRHFLQKSGQCLFLLLAVLQVVIIILKKANWTICRQIFICASYNAANKKLIKLINEESFSELWFFLNEYERM